MAALRMSLSVVALRMSSSKQQAVVGLVEVAAVAAVGLELARQGLKGFQGTAVTMQTPPPRIVGE